MITMEMMKIKINLSGNRTKRRDQFTKKKVIKRNKNKQRNIIDKNNMIAHI